MQEMASLTTGEQSMPLEDLICLTPQKGERVARPAREPSAAGAEIGTLVGIDDTGRPLVAFEHSPNGAPLPARSTVPIAATDAGREVVLMFESGDATRPLVLGLLQPSPASDQSPGVTVKRDGQRLVLSAQQEIELKCGKASIILTRAGKVLIRGAYVLSRSSGVNRLKGGVVHIN